MNSHIPNFYKTFNWKKPKPDTYHNIVLQWSFIYNYYLDVVIVLYGCLIKITWYAQQVKQKKALYNEHEETHFNDPRWKDQVWYLVSGWSLIQHVTNKEQNQRAYFYI